MAESAVTCCKLAVPGRRHTHPLALSGAPTKWRAKCSSSLLGMSLLSASSLRPSQSLSSKGAAAIFPGEPPSTPLRHHALAYGFTSRAREPPGSGWLKLRLCIGEGQGQAGCPRGLADCFLCSHG